MRALIVSSDRFEDRELSEPLQQLQAKGVDVAAPQQGPITGKHGHRVSAGLALGASRAEDYDLLLLPGGGASASLRKVPPRRWPSPGVSFRPTGPWLQSAMGHSS
jgi:protease I